tara:strand:- start:2059 stop:2763 length:705 start_codon:yes stop_codon:yes gene_type:complete
MAISVDRVYQTVLAIANKEQRGYITPQEFNLFANQAQNEIFEQYFHDLKLFLRIPGNKTVTSDPREMIEEKISIFRVANQGYSSSGGLSDNVYKLEAVRYKEAATGIFYAAEEVSKREYDAYHMSSLMAPGINRPIFYRSGNTIYRSPVGGYTSTHIDYIKRPNSPNWTYVVVNGDALFNPDTSAGWRDFELHPSEEKNLVVKILQFAGVSMKDQMLVQAASGKEVAYTQQEKS